MSAFFLLAACLFRLVAALHWGRPAFIVLIANRLASSGAAGGPRSSSHRSRRRFTHTQGKENNRPYLGELLIHAPILSSSWERGVASGGEKLSEPLPCLSESPKATVSSNLQVWSVHGVRSDLSAALRAPGARQASSRSMPRPCKRAGQRPDSQRDSGIGRVCDGGLAEGFREPASASPSQTARGCIPGGGVSQQRDWPTDLQKDPGHAKDTIYNTLRLGQGLSVRLADPSFFVSKLAQRPSKRPAKALQQAVRTQSRWDNYGS